MLPAFAVIDCFAPAVLYDLYYCIFQKHWQITDKCPYLFIHFCMLPANLNHVSRAVPQAGALLVPQELEQQFERERISLEEQKKRLREQLESLREELTAKLSMANSEVRTFPVPASSCFVHRYWSFFTVD